ncbi:MAG: aminodeoxychorismate/anthranilate synthase component II [Peptococcaceae bacterium]|nr:aminodeoxychorismate/anthranilate synthase component II [Peptococcaceae bacterium]
MVLMIDNYDSFVYNLVQYLREMGQEVQVYRNDKITLDMVERIKPDHIIISPGPCTPDKAGVSLNIIKSFSGRIPILGVCLGHQAIGQAFGGRVVRAPRPIHGKSSRIKHDGRGVFFDLPQQLEVGRYHSLVVSSESVPDCLEVSALSPDGEIMGLRHRKYKVEGVQFHPESILTDFGKEMLDNFLRSGDRLDESGYIKET